MVHEVEVGKNVRLSYSKIKEVLDMPNLIEVQKDSYKWFLEEGLKEIFHDISPITDHAGKLVLEFFDYRLDYNSKYSVEECKERDTKYAAPLRVSVRLINTETGEIKEQEIFMGDFPLMTEQGTFVINGAERVIVSQLVRSPGIYYEFERDKTGKPLYSSTVIPYRGAWLEYETDSNDVFSVRIDRTRKLPVTVLLRAMGLGSNAEILDVFGEDIRLLATFEKDTTESREEGLLEIYKRLRPGEPLNVENAESLIMNMFFDPRRYDLAKVGRYKFNKKLAISARIKGRTLAEPVADPRTGEIIANEGDAISADLAMQIERAGVNQVELLVEGKKVRVFSNNMVYLDEYVDFEVEDFHTYYVSDISVLTHNMCAMPNIEIWNKGSFESIMDSLEYHYKKHGKEVGANSMEEYLRKAKEFAKTAKKRNKGRLVKGKTVGTKRYSKNGKYIDLTPNGDIVSFGRI